MLNKEWKVNCIDNFGCSRNYEKLYRFFGFLILREKHEIGCRCSFCDELKNKPTYASGFWIPADKKGWWTIWWIHQTYKNYIRIT